MHRILVRSSLALPILLFIGVFFSCFPVGIIGEVMPTWGVSPQVLVQSTPPKDSILHEEWGFTLRATRPILSFFDLPIALNIYTSALPDWPYWLAYRITRSIQSILFLKLCFSMVFISYLWKKLTPFLSHFWTMVYLICLCSDWNFSFYKYTLGNTEILLQFAWVLCVFSLLQLQSGKNGSALLGWGIGIGFLAKITFILNLFPICLGLFFIQPQQLQWKKIIYPVLCCSLPFLCTFSLFLTEDIPIRSHDFFAMQWERIAQAALGNNTSIREQTGNIWYWLFDPLPFFRSAYRVSNIEMHWFGKSIGFIIGLTLLWRKRHLASIQLLFVLLLSQLLIFTVIAKDLHHLVIATPIFWLFWVEIWRQNTASRWTLILGITSILCGNIQVLINSPKIISAVETPSFSQTAQLQLATLLKEHNIQKLITMDYEIYGVLETITPEIEIIHGWGAISQERGAALPELLQLANNAHLIVLQSSSGMIYNLRPSQQRLEKEAKKRGLQLELKEGSSNTIQLYAISDRATP